MSVDNSRPPVTCNGNLSKLPRALAPLIERPQWAIWRWTPKPKGGWQKPPFMATQPSRNASTSNPDTWTDYKTALAAVHAGHGDGITYMLTEDDPFSAIDIDNCRHLDTHSIDGWAQLFMGYAVTSYQEVTPSGTGVRIWGSGNGPSVNRKFSLNIDGKDIGVELFRRTPKALTITGYRLDTVPAFTNIDKVVDWGIIWGERRKAAAIKAAAPINGFNGRGNGCSYGIDEIEQIVQTGAPAGSDRSAVFHTIVGHYLGCSWTAEQIIAHLQQHPDGIAVRYIHEDRLANEVWRSAGKYGVTQPVESRAPPPKDEKPEPKPKPEPDPELDNDDANNNTDPELDDELDEDANDGKAPPEIGMAADTLCAKQFDPLREVVPGYIVEGLTLFGGKPKTGKSWFMMHVALAKARGAFTLGDVYCAPADVLYCALEDNKRRLQRRLNKLLNGQPAPKRLRILSAGEMPLLSQGGLDLIRSWIEQAELPKLIVIDVLAKVRDPRRKEQGLYDADYAAMQGLKAIADEYGIAIVVIHHLRKMDAEDPLDQLSGTTGLSGAADTVLVLNRTSTGTILHGRGRDIEDIEKAVQFDRGNCTWTVLGEASSVQYSGERAAILKVLREAKGPMSLADIAAASRMKANNTRQLLLKLVGDGVVERIDRGKYALVTETKG
jgi:AAA domain/IclR helix-turn-helix domain